MKRRRIQESPESDVAYKRQTIAFLLSTHGSMRTFSSLTIPYIATVSEPLVQRMEGVSGDERIEALGIAMTIPILRVELRRRTLSDLTSFYRIITQGGEWVYGKQSLLCELGEYYRTGSLPTLRRDEERGVCALPHEDRDYVLCETRVPVDVLRIVLSFLRFRRELICSLGLVNWSWWSLVLSEWPWCKMRKANIFGIPTTVLRARSPPKN